MAHWVGVIEHGGKSVATGTSKAQVIEDVAYLLANRHEFGFMRTREIARQLQQDRDKVAVAYGENPGQIVAKVFSCNCGSIVRHEIKPDQK